MDDPQIHHRHMQIMMQLPSLSSFDSSEEESDNKIQNDDDDLEVNSIMDSDNESQIEILNKFEKKYKDNDIGLDIDDIIKKSISANSVASNKFKSLQSVIDTVEIRDATHLVKLKNQIMKKNKEREHKAIGIIPSEIQLKFT